MFLTCLIYYSLDIDECEFDPCHPKATCFNTPGSFKCSCPPDHVGDGTNLGIGCISLSPPTKTALYSGNNMLLSMLVRSNKTLLFLTCFKKSYCRFTGRLGIDCVTGIELLAVQKEEERKPAQTETFQTKRWSSSASATNRS